MVTFHLEVGDNNEVIIIIVISAAIIISVAKTPPTAPRGGDVSPRGGEVRHFPTLTVKT